MKPAIPGRPRVFAPLGPAFLELKRRVIERSGHFYYQDKDDLLWERVRRRVQAVRAQDAAEYLQRLELDADEWTALEAELTIGETYFFRYAEQFAALRDSILPQLLERNAAERRLRIWSAGCATGAEPYSLAILLHEMLGEGLRGWRISILGTDLNEQFLAAAETGVFGPWALRSLSPQQRAQWFMAEPGGRFRLRPQYKALVRFQRGNLLDLLGPTPPLELDEFDLILCRNVLIYFHLETVNAVAKALVQRLKPDGWLLVGHAEPNPEFLRFAEPAPLPEAVAYRPRRSAPEPAPPGPVHVQPPEPRPRPPRAPPPPRRPVLRPSPAPPPAAAPPPQVEATIAEVRRRADLGDYEGAAAACRAALDAAPDDPVPHFYQGLINQARSHLAAAEDSFRRAVYLDPRFIMAQYHLGLVRLERGRAEAGRRAIAAAAQLAGTLAVRDSLAEGAGLTAGELRDLARLQLESGAAGARP